MATNPVALPTKKAARPKITESIIERRMARVTVPLINFTIEVPRELIPFYVGLGAVVALELVDWPIALLIAAGHTLGSRSHNQVLRELGEGLESGA
jgi:hypothetical protein